MAVQNMSRIEINVHEKLCVKLVIYKDNKMCVFKTVNVGECVSGA